MQKRHRTDGPTDRPNERTSLPSALRRSRIVRPGPVYDVAVQVLLPPCPLYFGRGRGKGFSRKKRKIMSKDVVCKEEERDSVLSPNFQQKNIRGVRKRGCNSEPKCQVSFSPFVDATEPNPFSVTIAAAGQKKKRLLRTLPNQKGGKKILFLLFFSLPLCTASLFPFLQRGG